METSTDKAEEIIGAYQAGTMTQEDAARLLALIYVERIDHETQDSKDSTDHRPA